MSLAILFYFLCTQHVSDINISIIRSLRLSCSITTLVALFLFRCLLEIWCGWVWVVSVLQVEAAACNTDTTQTHPHQISNKQRNKNKTTNVVIQQHRRKLLVMDILMSKTCWVHKKYNKIASDIMSVFCSSAIFSSTVGSYIKIKHECFEFTMISLCVCVSGIALFNQLTDFAYSIWGRPIVAIFNFLQSADKMADARVCEVESPEVAPY